MKKNNLGNCPLCGKCYKSKKHHRTKHHIFPRYWFGSGVTVFVCHECHTNEFHRFYPMKLDGYAWTKKQCLMYWVQFCKSKGKEAFKIYPQLRPYQYLLY
ncbi:MAG TPA: hypothetical protein DCS12_08590 [Clostridiales bacterium]|nr:hypothetical protein [Clostridiales bacterium]